MVYKNPYSKSTYINKSKNYIPKQNSKLRSTFISDFNKSDITPTHDSNALKSSDLHKIYKCIHTKEKEDGTSDVDDNLNIVDSAIINRIIDNYTVIKQYVSNTHTYTIESHNNISKKNINIYHLQSVLKNTLTSNKLEM